MKILEKTKNDLKNFKLTADFLIKVLAYAVLIAYIVLMARPSGGRSSGAADGTWLSTMEYDIELYCHERNYDLERDVEDALDAIRLYWVKDYYFIESESLAETVFTVTVRED